MHDNPARNIAIFLEQDAQIITFLVGKMFFTEQGIAEGQARRNAVFLGECGNGLGVCITKSDTATTPQAIAGRSVNGADFTPLVKEFPMLAEQRQECLVQVIKFEQSGKVVENAHRLNNSYIVPKSEIRTPNSELSMRTLVLSDIHGSAFACKMALSYLDKLKCDRIFLLGDLLYHGPRNPLPGGHDPQGVVDLLSPLKDKITAVRGNCDAEVDQMVLGFPCLADFAEIEEGDLKLFLRHGHLYDPYLFSHYKADVYFSGHTHIFTAETNVDGVYCLNPGSTSLPKGGNPPTFGLYESAAPGRAARFSVHHLETGSELAAIEIKRD